VKNSAGIGYKSLYDACMVKSELKVSSRLSCMSSVDLSAVMVVGA
jgi:hypothetical protein